MNNNKYVFSVLASFLNRNHFNYLVRKYQGDRYIKSFSCWNQLLSMMFGQLCNREGLRDLVVAFEAHQGKLYHLGMGKSVTRSNLSKANEVREVRIFQEFADRMVAIARKKRDGIKDFFISNKVYAFDSSTISLCLSVYWWTKLHHGKGGVKLHELYDVKTDIPAFSLVTDASLHDSKVMDLIPYEKDSFYIFDRAYMVSEMLYLIHKAKAFFVVREKHKMVFKVVEDKSYNNPVTGVMADQIIKFTGNKTKNNYPEELRRVVFYDKEGNRTFVFYTNNTDVTAEEVALLYKFRWRCELFFKWLKQHLRVKEFYGTSENAVKIQIYAAIIAYCLVAIVQSELKLKMDTYDVLRILNVSLLTRMPLVDLLIEANKAEDDDKLYVQLSLDFKD